MTTTPLRNDPIARTRAHKMMPVVRRVALRMVKRLPASVDADDLIGAGTLGLTLALRRCVGEPDEVFEAYALSRIRGEMLEELRRMDPLSRHQRDKVRRVEKAERALRRTTPNTIPPKAIAAEAGMSEDKYREVTVLRAAGSPHAPLDVHEICVPADGRSGPAVEEAVDRLRALRRLEKAVHGLPPRLRRVLEGHLAGKTLRQIGDELGVSEARACQLRGKALTMLKRRTDRGATPAPTRPAPLRRVA